MGQCVSECNSGIWAWSLHPVQARLLGTWRHISLERMGKPRAKLDLLNIAQGAQPLTWRPLCLGLHISQSKLGKGGKAWWQECRKKAEHP